MALNATYEMQAAAEESSRLYSHLDLLINVSGILHIPGKMSPETALSRIQADNMLLSFQTNAIGPMLVCQHFMPMLSAAGKSNGATDDKPAVIANLSARVGSIGNWLPAFRHSHILMRKCEFLQQPH